MVDTGADVNAITYGMLIDHQLESQKIRLEEPLVLDLAVGKFECKEQVLIDWMGKGNAEHDTSTFYVLPRGEANITHRVILSKEWLKQRDLLYDEDERQGLKPLISGRQSVCMQFESPSVLAKMSHWLIVTTTNRRLRKSQGSSNANRLSMTGLLHQRQKTLTRRKRGRKSKRARPQVLHVQRTP